MITNIDSSEVLREKGVSPSLQRVAIYNFLQSHPVHPTVNMVYRALSSSIPTLSKTTVYNSLELFVERGLAQKITIDGYEARYDGDTALHGHFMCEVCKRLFDFSIDEQPEAPEELSGFKITDKALYFKGICRECLLEGRDAENSKH